MLKTVDGVLKIAANEIGYLEKSKVAFSRNHDIIYEKTAGAGRDNITVYGYEMHQIYPSVMDFPAAWCDAFVDWCFYKAYGVSTAKSMIGGNFDDYTVNSCLQYKKMNALGIKPKVGAQVFFTKNGLANGCYHTGIVYAVDDKFFYTIEGNTSAGNAVIPNGGGVVKKKYNTYRYYGRVLFGYPKYDTDTTDIMQIAREVIVGKWGTGADRKKRLTQAGYNADAVQAAVNQILKN